MDLVTIFIVMAVATSLAGCRRPVIGAAVGAVLLPLLYGLFISASFKFVVMFLIVGSGAGFLFAWVGHLFYSGFRGKGHNTGPSYMGGFGGGRGGAPPGGIILSDEERARHRRR